MLWGGRLKPGESVQVPDAPYVHLFITKGVLNSKGPVCSIPAMRFVSQAAGARRLTADAQHRNGSAHLGNQSRP